MDDYNENQGRNTAGLVALLFLGGLFYYWNQNRALLTKDDRIERDGGAVFSYQAGPDAGTAHPSVVSDE